MAKKKVKTLADLTADELADLRAGYDRQQAAAKAARDFEQVQAMREKKLEIQRELDRRHAARKAPKAAHVISGAGDIKSEEQVKGLGG